MATLDALTALIADAQRDVDGAFAEADAAPAGARPQDLDALKVAWTGRKSGRIAAFMAHLPSLPPADRKVFGQQANELKQQVETALAEREAVLAATRRPADAVDITLPGRAPALGHRHPLSLVREEVQQIFTRLGYQVLEGPEIEDDYHNFEALNMPGEHPARDMQDTLYLEAPVHAAPVTPWAAAVAPRARGPQPLTLLRTHTSAMQIRYMEQHDPPVRLVAIGPVYRRDNLDLTHTPMFHQVEGLVVGEGITLARSQGHAHGDGRGALRRRHARSASAQLLPLHRAERRGRHRAASAARARAAPSASTPAGSRSSAAAWCTRPCSRRSATTPTEVTGFAFGMGIERVAMLKWGVERHPPVLRERPALPGAVRRMKVLLSWLREFVDVTDGPAELGRRLSLRGLALEGIEPAPPGEAPPGLAPVEGDAVLDFDVTANRPDCLSVLGIAREIATVYQLPLRLPSADAGGHLRTAALTAVERSSFSVTLAAADLCPRYVGAAAAVNVAPVAGLDAARVSWRSACARSATSSTSPTTCCSSSASRCTPSTTPDSPAMPSCVRSAHAGETLTTLDGKTRTLSPSMLVIADAARAAAIGGVMGGARLRGARRHQTDRVRERVVCSGIGARDQQGARSATEASMRFERGADPTVTATAMARACALLEFIGAGTPDGTMVDAQAHPMTRRVVQLTHDHIEGLLGMPVPVAEVERILEALGFTTASAAPGAAWQVTVPGWRPDIARAEDLIEEVGRHHGFEHLPATFPPVSHAPPPSDPRMARDGCARRAMLAMGFSEAISFAFIEAAAAAPFGDGGPPIVLANPLSETFAVMRPSVLAGVVDAVSHNRRHGRRDVRLFEIGTAFGNDGERRSLAAAWTGEAAGEHWSGGRRDVDFFDVKGAVEHLGAALGVALTFDLVEPASLAPGRAAGVLAGARRVGVCGLLAPALADARGIPRNDDVYVLEVNLDAVAAAAPPGAMRVEPLPRFPAVVRDVSLLVDDSLSSATVRDTIRRAAPATLVSLSEFDRYQGRGVPAGRVSVSLRLTFRADDRTLTDDEVGTAMAAVLAAARAALNAEQR